MLYIVNNILLGYNYIPPWIPNHLKHYLASKDVFIRKLFNNWTAKNSSAMPTDSSQYAIQLNRHLSKL